MQDRRFFLAILGAAMLFGAEARAFDVQPYGKDAAQAARVAGCGALEMAVHSDDAALLAFCRATGFAEVGPRFVRALRKGGSG